MREKWQYRFFANAQNGNGIVDFSPKNSHTNISMRFAARLFIFLSIFSLFLFPFITPALAQTTSPITPSMDTNVPLNMHTYTQSIMLEMLSATFCLLSGTDPTNPGQPCLGFDPTTHKIGYVQSTGLVGAVANMTAVLFTPPLHTMDYIGYAAHNFGLVKQTYAANSTCDPSKLGTGFCGISPLIGIWTVSRNIVYLFFVVIFILIGFGIMLRMKIDPRTVMSIENQIPKLIIALILVTFSFAIAGLMIDGMWVGSFVAVKIITAADNTASPIDNSNIDSNTVNNSFFQNPIGFSDKVLPGGIIGVAAGSGGSMGDVIRGLFTPTNTAKLGLDPSTTQDCNNTTTFWGGIGNFFCQNGQALGNLLPGLLGYLLSWIISVLGAIVVLIAILIAMFRLWFTLLLSYAYILIDVILAPFMIAFGVIPGSKVGFGSWARDILANLMAFPTTIAMFLLARLLMDAFTQPGGTASLFVAPLIGNPNGTAGSGNPLGFLIGMAVILMTPQSVAIMKGAFKVQEGKLGQAIGASLAGGAGQLVGTAKSVGKTVMASREYTPQKDSTTGEGYRYRERGVGNAIWSNLFGGR